MAINPNEEEYHFATKILLYMTGVSLGLGAKLAFINKNGVLTWKEAIYHTVVAFACAWCMWYGFKSVGKPEFATWAAVICGRFGDNVLMVVWAGVRKAIGKIGEDVAKD